MELLLPQRCAGCGTAGTALCDACRGHLAKPPQRIFTNVDPFVPVWAFGTYAGVHRSMVLGMKERGRRDVPSYLGPLLLAGLEHLAARGELPEPSEMQLVPAPTKRSSARKRGGDPVTAFCKCSGLETVACVRHASGVRDSVGLDASARRTNLSGNVVVEALPTKPILIVDDVVTTGATIAATTSVLVARNIEVVGAISICFA